MLITWTSSTTLVPHAMWYAAPSIRDVKVNTSMSEPVHTDTNHQAPLSKPKPTIVFFRQPCMSCVHSGRHPPSFSCCIYLPSERQSSANWLPLISLTPVGHDHDIHSFFRYTTASPGVAPQGINEAPRAQAAGPAPIPLYPFWFLAGGMHKMQTEHIQQGLIPVHRMICVP